MSLIKESAGWKEESEDFGKNKRLIYCCFLFIVQWKYWCQASSSKICAVF